MRIELPLWYSIVLCMAGMYFGFWVGRSRTWGRETAAAPMIGQPLGKSLLSPAGGMIESFSDGGYWGLQIHTTDSMLRSPVSGRVLKIMPRGNEFLIRADWGGEIHVRACDSEDDLLDHYFRPRVVRGEVISKGKILLEYDRESLSKEGRDTTVYLTTPDTGRERVEMTGQEWVGAGDQVMWIYQDE